MKKSLFLLTTITVLFFIAGFASAQDRDTNAILLEDYPAIEYWVGLWNGQSDPDAYRDFLAPAYQNYDALSELGSGGPRLVYGDIPELRQGHDDFSIQVYEVISENDTVIVRYLAAIVDNEERSVYPGIVLFRLDGEKIANTWHLYDSCMMNALRCNSAQPII